MPADAHKREVSGTEAREMVLSDMHLKNLVIRGSFEMSASQADNWEWQKEIVIENCIVEDLQIPMFHAAKPVVFLNSDFKKIDLYAPYFLSGLLVKNCLFETVVDFQSGGHNKNGTEFRLEGNVFKEFVNFFDDWFEGPVVVKDNKFEKGTNLLSTTQMVTFDVAPEISGNSGEINIEGEN